MLLVDDDPDIGRFLAMLLELEGFSPEVATRGEEAIAACERARPAAVLLDVAMPGLDGLELCRRLRGSGLDCPILVVSARPGSELGARALEAGADEFIRKPFDNADLLDRLRHHLSQRGRGVA
ncbi:MAG TPA: response regulator [Anaeromyxobacteraceae bacterium]|nr:response regulator [Anaeromyxobacteraceae bacterium]